MTTGECPICLEIQHNCHMCPNGHIHSCPTCITQLEREVCTICRRPTGQLIKPSQVRDDILLNWLKEKAEDTTHWVEMDEEGNFYL